MRLETLLFVGFIPPPRESDGGYKSDGPDGSPASVLESPCAPSPRSYDRVMRVVALYEPALACFCARMFDALPALETLLADVESKVSFRIRKGGEMQWYY